MTHTVRSRASALALALLATACSDATAPNLSLAPETTIAPSRSLSASATTIYATEVVASSQGLRKDGTAVTADRSDPAFALGAPDAQFFSLGFGGSIAMKFAEPFSGTLLLSFEQTEVVTYPVEIADVYISANGVDYLLVGQVTNEANPESPIREASLALPAGCWQYVRIVDRSDPAGFEDTADGFDVNAIAIADTVACATAAPAGCSQGYYSTHDVPGDERTFASFGITNTGKAASFTLEDALQAKGGGPTVQAAKNLLLTQAAAALLNSMLVDGFPLTTAEVVAQVNTALASGDRDTILALKDELDDMNNLGCELGNTYPNDRR